MNSQISWRVVFLLALVVCGNAVSYKPSVAADLFNPNRAVREESRLFPIMPKETDLTSDPKRTLTREMGEQIYERCIAKIPPRFTPEAHRYYCTCSAAATVGTMTRGEIHQLQNAKNRVTGNKTMEKYATEVMAPCLDMPVGQIEYLNCVLNVHNDRRIYDIPQYCQCMSKGMAYHFKKFGLSEMMITWDDGKSQMFDDPVAALWENDTFMKARDETRDTCVGQYMRVDLFKDSNK